jgi:hypothetical protein
MPSSSVVAQRLQAGVAPQIKSLDNFTALDVWAS